MTELEHAIKHIKTRADAWAVKEVTEALQSISERLDKALSQELCEICCATCKHEKPLQKGYECEYQDECLTEGKRGKYEFAYSKYEPKRVKPELNVELNEIEPCDDTISRILKRMWNCRGKHTTSIDKVAMEQIIRDELSVTQKSIECDDTSIEWYDLEGYVGSSGKRGSGRMTKEETVKNLLTELIDMIDNGSQRDLDRADEIGASIIKLFKQEPCTDAVSREAVLNAICDYVALEEYEDKSHTFTIRPLTKRIKQLPSVTQKSGEWIKDECGNVICSECKRFRRDCRYGHTNYCNHCGCRMFEPQESEEQTE